MTEAGAKPTVVPFGCPLALSATDCADPLVTAVDTVDEPPEPWATLRLLGAAASEKSEGCATVRLTVVACVAAEPVPVTVIV